MRSAGRGWRASAFCVTALLSALSLSLFAHERKTVGSVVLIVGWGDEPAYTGFRNFVEVDVADAAGAPVADPAGALSVEVSFGAERTTLPLSPAGKAAGHYRAALVPTRPGTYAFHITGVVHGERVDVTSTCSDQTFACVRDASDVQFPAKDPTAGQLAERIDRAVPRAERAAAAAASARTLSVVSLAIAVAALFAAIRATARRAGKRD